MEHDDGFRPLLADDEPDEGSLGDLAAALEEDFSTGLVGSGKGKPGGAPVYVYVDDTPLPSEGARTFEHVSGSTRAASAQWHCQHVRIAQVILLTTSSVQCLLGLVLSAAFIGILPLVSSILGIISATQYFVAEASSLEQVLNSAFILGAIATPLNLVFDIIYMLAEIKTEFRIPLLDILALVFFGQAAAFLWIAIRARRVKNLLLPNSTS